MAKILNSIVEATGQTPLVKLNRLDEGLPGNVAVKLEFYNPAGSVKDRIGRAIIDAAEKSGELSPAAPLLRAPPVTPVLRLLWWVLLAVTA